MQQIADWLEKLGMSEYAQRFAENEIDFAALRHLTDQDLKDIGVSARASADNSARLSQSLGALRQDASPSRPSRSPKTPQSAAKSP